MKKLSLLFLFISQLSFAQYAYFPGECTPDKLFCAYFSPDDMPISAIETYIYNAKRSIKIATYNMNVNTFTPLLRMKLGQGVKVEFLVDYKLSFESNSVWRSLSPHQNLTKYRIPVLRGGNPQMHNKLIIIDEKVVLMGSANFTYSGLAGNYENVMAVGEPTMVRRFIEEFEELKNFSKITCEVMSGVGCGTGQEKYPADFNQLLTTGKFPGTSLVSSAGVCGGVASGRGLLTSENRVFNASVPACFKEKEKYEQLTSLVAANERLSGSRAGEKYQVYFSPEDNLESVILRELSKTLVSPSQSFAYISVNFITNKNFAAKLVEMKRSGVRMKIFFDRGRFDDANFQQSIQILNELGFSRGGDDESQIITIFDNQLVGPYGCNHNKLAVVGVGSEITLLNGSANWSAGAMTKNDENLTVVKDTYLATIYMREIVSQLAVYRFGQNLNSPGFGRDIEFLSRFLPCLKSYLGLERKCAVNKLRSTAAISVDKVPMTAGERLWAWVPQLNSNRGGAVEFYTHETFNGKWIGSIPMPLNTTYNFKMFKAPLGIDPNRAGIGSATWEYSGPDRSVTSAPIAIGVIRGSYVWGY